MIARVLLVLALFAAHARADDVKPWAADISEAEQTLAIQIYEEGNLEFQAARFVQALAKYTEALEHWDHPAIHFNMAVCFINLDQPIEARQHLEKALAFGPDPLGQDLYAQGITHRHSLDGQIARVKIRCLEPGTVITLDGAYLFTAPGEVERLVLPGKHQIVGTKPGFITASESLDLLPARVTRHDVHLIALKAPTKLVRRWPVWQPWAVIGTGAAIASIGGLFYLSARRELSDYDANIAKACPHGCTAEMRAQLDDIESLDDAAYTKRTAAVSLFAIGGAVIATGGLGLYLNQPHTVVVAPTQAGASAMLHVTW